MSSYRILDKTLGRRCNDAQSVLICQFNCNRMSARLSELRLYVYSRKPDVMCLCETWSPTPEPRFVGYQAVWKHRVGRQGGGLCVLIRNDIPFTLNSFTSVQGAQLEFLSVRLFTSLGALDLVTLYNPCLDIPLAEFAHITAQLCPLNILIGDFNAHSPLWDNRSRSNFTGRSLEQLLDLQSHGVLNDYYVPTYVDGRTGTTSCLDLCLPSLPLLSRGHLVTGVDIGSDHLPIECTFGLMLQKVGAAGPLRWLVKHGNWSRWHVDLSSSPLGLVVPATAEELNEDICSRLLSVSRQHIPQSSGGTSAHRRTPWWSPECSRAVAKRRRARQKLCKSPTLANLIAYRKFSAMAKHTILKRKRESWRNYVNSLGLDTPAGQVWRTIRSINGVSMARPVLAVGGPEAPLRLKAQLLLEHFVPPSYDFLRFNAAHVFDVVSSLSSHDIVETTYNVPFTIVELRNCIRCLKNSSPGSDTVLNLFLHRLPQYFLSQFLYLFNASYFTGSVPDSWKLGIICPIPKPGKDPLAVTGYRPITLLSCIGKLMERLLKGRLDHYLESQSVFSCFQTGFRKGRSTADALVLIKYYISCALENGLFCLNVYLDLSQAYDCVWHNGLLFKLLQVGCDIRTVLWLKSYLQDRFVKVRVGDRFSESRRLVRGLPQGAVLSPTLFNVMLHDLPTSPLVKVVSYADDITLICSGTSALEVRRHMQDFLDTLTQWFSRWCFTINPGKSSYQLYSRGRSVTMLNLVLSGHNLSFAQEQRVLGVIFDAPKLSLVPHVRRLRVECLRRVNVLKALSSVRWGSSRDLLRRVYLAFIRSKLLYGHEIYPTFPAKTLNLLNVVQNSALRCIIGARKTSPVVSLEVESCVMPLALCIQFSYLKWCLRMSCGPAGASELAGVVQLFSAPPVGWFSARRVELTRLCGSPVLKGAAGPYISPVAPCSDLPTLISTSCPDFALPSVAAVNDQFDAFLSSHYPEHIAVYTDGSRLDSGSVSAAVYFPSTGVTCSWLLNPSHTVMGAELYAIHQALRFVAADESLSRRRVVIFSDCMSALYLLCDISSNRYRTVRYRVQDLLARFAGRVVLQWVPAHCGIDGNEVADQCARLGHANSVSALTTLNYEEMLPLLRESFVRYWTAVWDAQVETSGKGRFLRDIVAGPYLRRCVSGVPRAMQSAVARLRIGHVGVASHLHRFRLAESPLCPECRVPETVLHYLLECPRYGAPRQILRASLESLGVPVTLSNVLGCGRISPAVDRQILRALCAYIRATNRVFSL